MQCRSTQQVRFACSNKCYLVFKYCSVVLVLKTVIRENAISGPRLVLKEISHCGCDVLNMCVCVYMSYNNCHPFSVLHEVGNGLRLRDHIRSWSSLQPDPVLGPVLLKEFLSVEETDSSLTVLTAVRLH